mgnify:CR=1 FL=1|jgi:16S rRNA processing protein RimM
MVGKIDAAASDQTELSQTGPGENNPDQIAPVVAGRIGAAFGVRGWVHVKSYLHPPHLLFDMPCWAVSARQGDWRPVQVADGRDHGRGFVVKLVGVDNRDDAEMLRGNTIGIDPEALPAPEAGEYYWSDLLGAAVVSSDGFDFGRLEAMMETGANDVMVVVGDRERLIPFVFDDVVREVDLRTARIEVVWDPDD